MITSEQLHQKLLQLEEKRKSGELDMREFYRELLKLAFSLKEFLLDEVDRLEPAELKRQIPIVLVFLEEIIAEMERLEKRKASA